MVYKNAVGIVGTGVGDVPLPLGLGLTGPCPIVTRVVIYGARRDGIVPRILRGTKVGSISLGVGLGLSDMWFFNGRVAMKSVVSFN